MIGEGSIFSTQHHAFTAGMSGEVVIEFLAGKRFDHIANMAGGLIEW
jgi:hypothetical protein